MLVEKTTIMFIIFWDFSMVEPIFLSPQVTENVIISNKLVYIICFMSWQTTQDLGNSRKISKFHSIIV